MPQTMNSTARKDSWKEISAMTPGHTNAISRAANVRLANTSSSRSSNTANSYTPIIIAERTVGTIAPASAV